MDYSMFYNYFVKCIKEKTAADYGVELTDEQTVYNVIPEEGTVTLSFTGSSAYLTDKAAMFAEKYRFMSNDYEIVTYCATKKTEDGLRIIHQRVLQAPDANFAIISSACEISNISDNLVFDGISSWLDNFVRPTYEGTLFNLCCNGHFNLDKELSCVIKMDVAPEDLYAQMYNERTDLLELLKETNRG